MNPSIKMLMEYIIYMEYKKIEMSLLVSCLFNINLKEKGNPVFHNCTTLRNMKIISFFL